MLHTLWTTILTRPLYNILLLTIAIVPGGDVGIAVVLVTLLVKLILAPLTQKSIKSQIAMKAIEPDIAKIKAEVSDKTEQSKRTYALYKEKGVNPFSGCLLILLQLPIIIALYLVLRNFATISLLPYSFTHIPAVFNLKFLGLVDIGHKSIVLALLAGVTQFIQGKLAQGRQNAPSTEGMAGMFAKNMQVQMLYMIPLVTAYAAYQFSAAVALYLITSNIFTIGQELYTLRQMRTKTVVA
jgi:YidC/Oxa1 family membrane protein insertase